ncbi:hypothetical protein ACFE04_002108 [Oxalis oulophora]
MSIVNLVANTILVISEIQIDHRNRKNDQQGWSLIENKKNLIAKRDISINIDQWCTKHKIGPDRKGTQVQLRMVMEEDLNGSTSSLITNNDMHIEYMGSERPTQTIRNNDVEEILDEKLNR